MTKGIPDHIVPRLISAVLFGRCLSGKRASSAFTGGGVGEETRRMRVLPCRPHGSGLQMTTAEIRKLVLF